MAKIGVRKMFYAKYDSDGVYTGGKQFGKISSFNFAPTVSNVKDYGDDVVAEVFNETTGGKLSIEANQLTLEERATLLGHTYSQQDGMIVNAEDVADYFGVGAIGVERQAGTTIYVAKWYKKLMFTEPNDDNSTKQENVSPAHTTIEADVLPQENYDISHVQTFASEADAVAWLQAKACITTTPAVNDGE